MWQTDAQAGLDPREDTFRTYHIECVHANFLRDTAIMTYRKQPRRVLSHGKLARIKSREGIAIALLVVFVIVNVHRIVYSKDVINTIRAADSETQPDISKQQTTTNELKALTDYKISNENIMVGSGSGQRIAGC